MAIAKLKLNSVAYLVCFLRAKLDEGGVNIAVVRGESVWQEKWCGWGGECWKEVLLTHHQGDPSFEVECLGWRSV